MSSEGMLPDRLIVPWCTRVQWLHAASIIFKESHRDWDKGLLILYNWERRNMSFELSNGLDATRLLIENVNEVNRLEMLSADPYEELKKGFVGIMDIWMVPHKRHPPLGYQEPIHLPKWLTLIRDDIVFGTARPTRKTLKDALTFFLKWLRVKYWRLEGYFMKDYVAIKYPDHQINLKNCTIEGTIRLYSRGEVAARAAVNARPECQNVLERMCRALSQQIVKVGKPASVKVCKLLVFDKLMLATRCETDSKGNQVLPRAFVNSWFFMFRALYEAKIMLDVANALLDVCSDDDASLLHRLVASLWLKEIFRSCIHQAGPEYTQLKDQDFLKRIRKNKNAFTKHFIKEVRKIIPDNQQKTKGNQTSRWERIDDVSPYINLPIGVLPNQRSTVDSRRKPNKTVVE